MHHFVNVPFWKNRITFLGVIEIAPLKLLDEANGIDPTE